MAHFGRHIPVELRTALELGTPPGFDGAGCTEPGCRRRYGLEWDHIDPVAHNGPTSYDNLSARCKPHHWDALVSFYALAMNSFTFGTSNRKGD